MAFFSSSSAGTFFRAIPVEMDGRVGNEYSGGCRLNRPAEQLRLLRMLGKGFVVGKGSNAEVGLKGRVSRVGEAKPTESRTEPELDAHRFPLFPPVEVIVTVVRGCARERSTERVSVGALIAHNGVLYYLVLGAGSPRSP